MWICSTGESLSVEMSHIISTDEDTQCQGGYAVLMSHIINLDESHNQYGWEYTIQLGNLICIENLSHLYCIYSSVLMIWLTFHVYPHLHRGCNSYVLHILASTANSLYKMHKIVPRSRNVDLVMQHVLTYCREDWSGFTTTTVRTHKIETTF